MIIYTNQTNFEQLAIIRGYCEHILAITKGADGNSSLLDTRPSTAKMVLTVISRMHNIKDRLEIE